MSDEKDYTLFIGNLTEKITEKLLHELFIQAGPIENVSLKKGFGFITFAHHISVPYTLRLFEGIQLFGRNIVLKPRDGSIYANSMKDIRRSKSMNEFTGQGGPSNRSSQNPKSIHKVPSLTEIDVYQSRNRGSPGFNQPWSAPNNFQAAHGSKGKSHETSVHNRYSQFKQEGNMNVGHGNSSMPVGDFRDRRMDGKHSSRNQDSPSGTYGNRNAPYRNDSGSGRDYESRYQGKNAPHIRRDSQGDRDMYFDRKNSNSGGFAISPQDSWKRDGGGRSYGNPHGADGQQFDRNFRRANSFTPQRKDGSFRPDHNNYRPHHDKPYNRPHNPKHSMEGHSRNSFDFGGGSRR